VPGAGGPAGQRPIADALDVTCAAIWRGSVGVIWRASADADDEGAGRSFGYCVGGSVELVGPYDALDLGDESLEEPEVPARDAGDGLGVVGRSRRFDICSRRPLTASSEAPQEEAIGE